MTIEDTLRTFIRKQLASYKPLDLGLDTSLLGLFDSTGAMELTVWIENTFGFSVEIDDVTPENFATIRALAAWVRRNTKLSA
jgi:acyl carrier protein